MGWIEFVSSLLVFFVSHSVPVRPPVRTKLVRVLGQRGFTVAYSLLSLSVLGWVIGAAGRAPHVLLWDWAVWHGHLALVAMLLVCLILSLGVAAPNPFSFGGARNDAFDPARPGLVRLTRHPLLVALAVWASVHVVANGTLSYAILFGGFAAFAVLGVRLVDRRKQREMGKRWHELRDAVALAPFRFPASTGSMVLRLGAGVAAYLVLLWVHPYVFGVNPWP